MKKTAKTTRFLIIGLLALATFFGACGDPASSENSQIISSTVSIPASSESSSSEPSLPSSESQSSAPSSLPASSQTPSKPASQATSSTASTPIQSPYNIDPEFEWALILVNKNYPLSEEYEPQISQYNSRRKFETRAMSYLKDMVAAAKSDGITLNVISSYRTYERQVELFDASVKKLLNKGYSKADAEAETAITIAPPGTSEHCTGLAVDIVSTDWYDHNSNLNEKFELTEEFEWLISNCHKYGFVIRYPKDKEDITMIGYEPWHYRFVGPAHAEQIMENGLCLEEFLGRS